MKKYLIFALFASISFTVQSQNTKLSIVAGAQNATVQDDFLSQGFDTGAGYYVGLGAEFSLTKRSGIYSELTYSNVNSTEYFQLPILYKYRFADKISILVGPQIGYASEDTTINLTGLSIGLGGALRYDFSRKFYAIARYTFQLNDHNTDQFPNVNYRIDMGSVGIGFTF